MLREDLAVERGQQVDVRNAQVGACDFLANHARRQATQALSAQRLEQFGRDEAQLAHGAHQVAVEHACAVALQKARRHARLGKAACVLSQRLQVIIDVGIHLCSPDDAGAALIWRTCGTRACAFLSAH